MNEGWFNIGWFKEIDWMQAILVYYCIEKQWICLKHEFQKTNNWKFKTITYFDHSYYSLTEKCSNLFYNSIACIQYS